mgnify:CR=1 FL=1
MNRAERTGDDIEALRTFIDGRQSGMWTALPGVVVSVNFVKQTVSIQPSLLIGVLDPATGVSSNVTMPLLVDVPICWPRGGGYALTFPIAVGDEVLVVFASRCIDSWWQAGGTANPPAENRMHDLSDGFAIFSPTSQPKKLVAVSSTSVQLRNQFNSSYVEIAPGDVINITAYGGTVNVTTDTANVSAASVVVNSDTSSVTAATSATITAPTITLASSDVKIGTNTFISHTHSSGGAGPPVPGT